MAISKATQLCAWVEKPGKDAVTETREIEIPEPRDGEVLIKLIATGVCHSDCHSIYGNTPMTTHIAGHEGVGRVIKVGNGVSGDFEDARVGISWLYRACGKCEICKVDYTHCPNQDNSGRNVSGTFQQYVTAPAEYVTRIPDSLPAELAAPLLCGGITMYGAILKARLRPGDYVVIPGAGGGLGHLGIQIAKHLGFKVIALDTGEAKRTLCKDLGAAYFLDFAIDDVQKRILEITNVGAHAVVCAAGSAVAYETAIPMLRNCGTLVCVGLPAASFRLPVNPFEMVVRGIVIVGRTVGNREEMKELLELAVQGIVVPHVEVSDFAEINSVLKRLVKFQVTGRAVLKIPQ